MAFDSGVLVPCMALTIPLVAIFVKSQQKIAEMKIQMGVGAGTESAALNEVKNEIQALRREVASLRDTTTAFDMSFDAAISRLETRVDRIEDTKSAVSPLRSTPPTRTDEEHIILGQKG